MKLILTAEVDHLGGPATPSRSKDGYGRNFLCCRAAWPSWPPVVRRSRPTTSAAPATPRPSAAASTQRDQGRHRQARPGRPGREDPRLGQAVRSVTANDVVTAIKKAAAAERRQAIGAPAQSAHQGDRFPHRRGASAPRGRRRRHPGHFTPGVNQPNRPKPWWRPLPHRGFSVPANERAGPLSQLTTPAVNRGIPNRKATRPDRQLPPDTRCTLHPQPSSAITCVYVGDTR